MSRLSELYSLQLNVVFNSFCLHNMARIDKDLKRGLPEISNINSLILNYIFTPRPYFIVLVVCVIILPSENLSIH